MGSTLRSTPHGTQGRYVEANVQNRCPVDGPRSGIRAVHPYVPPAMPLPCLRTRYVQIHSTLSSHQSAINHVQVLGRDHVHARTSTTQPSRLQKLVRASREIFVGRRPSQSTRDGSRLPLHLGTVRLSSSMMALDVSGSNGFPSSKGCPKSPGDRLYGRLMLRSMRRLCPQMVIGTRWCTRIICSTRSLLEYTMNAYFESGPMTMSSDQKTQLPKRMRNTYA